MSDPDQRSVLSRIVAAHLGAGTDHSVLEAALQAGLTRAIRRASLPFATLTPAVEDVSVAAPASLQDALDAMPEHGLTAAIEDEEGRRGLVALDHPLVDALIEVQATGSVEEVTQPPRKITRIDEALCRDFVELILASFAKETAEAAGRDWPDRLRYGSHIADRAQLNLLMPDRGYRLLRTTVTMGGHKTGGVVVLLPSDPAIARRRVLAAPAEAAPVDWSDEMLTALSAAPMALDAVLMRVTMPLGKVEALEEGDLVPFDHSDLSAVTLEDETGHVFARGGLGQLSGRRAVRLGSPDQGQAPAQADTQEATLSLDMMAGAPSMAAQPMDLGGPGMAMASGGGQPSGGGVAPGFDANAALGTPDPAGLAPGTDIGAPPAAAPAFDPDAAIG